MPRHREQLLKLRQATGEKPDVRVGGLSITPDGDASPGGCLRQPNRRLRLFAFCHGSAPFSGLIELRDMLHSKSGRKIPMRRLEALFEALRGGINTS